MLTLLARLARCREGQDLAEYGIALAVIVGFTAVVALAVGTDVEILWSNAQSVINDATTP